MLGRELVHGQLGNGRPTTRPFRHRCRGSAPAFVHCRQAACIHALSPARVRHSCWGDSEVRATGDGTTGTRLTAVPVTGSPPASGSFTRVRIHVRTDRDRRRAMLGRQRARTVGQRHHEGKPDPGERRRLSQRRDQRPGRVTRCGYGKSHSRGSIRAMLRPGRRRAGPACRSSQPSPGSRRLGCSAQQSDSIGYSELMPALRRVSANAPAGRRRPAGVHLPRPERNQAQSGPDCTNPGTRHSSRPGGTSGSAHTRTVTFKRQAWTRPGAANTSTTHVGGSGATS